MKTQPCAVPYLVQSFIVVVRMASSHLSTFLFLGHHVIHLSGKMLPNLLCAKDNVETPVKTSKGCM